MKMTFLGSGSHGTLTNYQSNMLLSHDNKNLLIDCGTDIRHSLNAAGYKARDIDAVFISHLHSDHAGGLEWLAFNTYFDPSRWQDGEYVRKPILFVEDSMCDLLWYRGLYASLHLVQDRPIMNLTDYFDVQTFRPFDNIRWNDTLMATVAALHIQGTTHRQYSHGLTFVTPSLKTVYLTTDTQFDPKYFGQWYDNTHLIFHEVETTGYKSGVHTHYSDLNSLPLSIKQKMWLYHHSDDNPYYETCEQDGFHGFVSKGQTFTL